MESEWVKVIPYLGMTLPDTAVNDDYPGVKESKEIYQYFFERNQKSPVDDFITFYSNLSMTPKIGQSKMDQILEAVRLMKLSDKIQSQMRALGIQ